MKEIKTKENYNKMKSVEQAVKASRRISGAYIKAKDKVTQATETNQNGVYEYADETLGNMVEKTSTSAKVLAKRSSQKIIQKQKEIRAGRISDASKKTDENVPSAPRNVGDGTVHEKGKNYFIKSKIKRNAVGPSTIKEKIVAFLKGRSNITVNTAKIAITNTKTLAAVLLGVGSIGAFFVIIICTIAIVMGSSYGIFLATEDTGTGYTLNSVITIINEEYFAEIDKITAEVPHDDLVVTGEVSFSNWKDILAVYAVKVTTAQEGNEVVTIDEDKMKLIREIFWDMTEISYTTEPYEEIEVIEITDEEGNITEQETAVIKTRLIMSVKNKTTGETVEMYDFNKNQIMQLKELLSKKNSDLWKVEKKRNIVD